jgi:hypothetical protein
VTSVTGDGDIERRRVAAAENMGASKVQASLKHYGWLGKAGIENVGPKFPLLLASTEAIFFTASDILAS